MNSQSESQKQHYCTVCLLSSSSPSTLFGSTENRPKIKSQIFVFILFYFILILTLCSSCFSSSPLSYPSPLVLVSLTSPSLSLSINRHRLVRSLSFLFLPPLLNSPPGLLSFFLFLNLLPSHGFNLDPRPRRDRGCQRLSSSHPGTGRETRQGGRPPHQKAGGRDSARSKGTTGPESW